MGCDGNGFGALTSYFYAFRDREMINDIFEETCGARLTMNYNIPGGLMFDIHPNFVKRTKDFIAHFRTKIPEYDKLVTGNVIFQKRTKGIGILSREQAISYGARGRLPEARTLPATLEKDIPTVLMTALTLKKSLVTEGDNLARYQVRIARCGSL